MLNMILADDEPIITRGIRKLVDWEKLGIFIEGEYRDGHSAMEAILSGQPDLALLDISMPGMNGIDILKSIREMELKTKVVFILKAAFRPSLQGSLIEIFLTVSLFFPSS